MFAYSPDWMSLQAYRMTAVQPKVKCSSFPQHMKPSCLYSVNIWDCQAIWKARRGEEEKACSKQIHLTVQNTSRYLPQP